MAQLKLAHSSVNPKSSTYWVDIASFVYDKSPAACRDTWFSLIKTPQHKGSLRGPKADSVAVNTATAVGEDDIFDSTPMRKNHLLEHDRKLETKIRDDLNLGSAIKIEMADIASAAQSVVVGDSDAGKVEFRPRAGYKSYLQEMRRDMRRHHTQRKGSKKKNGLALPRIDKFIDECLYDGDVDLNARLSPGGTLQVKSLHHEDEDDFWEDREDDDSEDDEAS
jgi:hypothetical protein